FRETEGDRFITDMGNYIIDLDLKKIEDPKQLANELDHTVGVVEHGLFNGMVNKVIVAGKNGLDILEK
ncbi:TPA: ribose-5-phosphate isomerase A, partial [Streptococcus agalactiae]